MAGLDPSGLTAVTTTATLVAAGGAFSGLLFAHRQAVTPKLNEFRDQLNKVHCCGLINQLMSNTRVRCALEDYFLRIPLVARRAGRVRTMWFVGAVSSAVCLFAFGLVGAYAASPIGPSPIKPDVQAANPAANGVGAANTSAPKQAATVASEAALQWIAVASLLLIAYTAIVLVADLWVRRHLDDIETRRSGWPKIGLPLQCPNGLPPRTGAGP